MANKGFFARRRPEPPKPLPPGQYLENGFPVLSAGPTPHTRIGEWTFVLEHAGNALAEWTWNEFHLLPQEEVVADIHCVTRWSKLDTNWKGVTVETLLEEGGIDPPEEYVMAFCDGGYTTNLPWRTFSTAKAWWHSNMTANPRSRYMGAQHVF